MGGFHDGFVWLTRFVVQHGRKNSPVRFAQAGDLLIVKDFASGLNERGNSEIANGCPISAAASSIVFFKAPLSRKLIRASLLVVGMI